MSVHRLVSQQSRIGTSLTKQPAVAVGSNVLQIQPDWLCQVELDHAQEWLDSGIDPSVIVLNVGNPYRYCYYQLCRLVVSNRQTLEGGVQGEWVPFICRKLRLDQAMLNPLLAICKFSPLKSTGGQGMT